jgi:hypothetical protein
MLRPGMIRIAPDHHGRSRRPPVLVIEGGPGVREVLTYLLAELGCEGQPASGPGPICRTANRASRLSRRGVLDRAKHAVSVLQIDKSAAMM